MEALEFFRAHADDWRKKAEQTGLSTVNIIAQRNACVLRCLERMGSAKKFLDVGCGTGELVIEVRQYPFLRGSA